MGKIFIRINLILFSILGLSYAHQTMKQILDQPNRLLTIISSKTAEIHVVINEKNLFAIGGILERIDIILLDIKVSNLFVLRTLIYFIIISIKLAFGLLSQTICENFSVELI